MQLWAERTCGLDCGLVLTTELFIKITDRSTSCIKRIQILPDEIVNKTPEIQMIVNETVCNIVSFNDDVLGIQEIVISNSNFKEIFLESYQYIYKNENLNNDLNKLRMASFGILLVTPIDTTALRINYDCLYQLNELGCYFETYFLLAGYLTCNYDKTNKSSCIWEYFKKIHVLLLVQINADNLEKDMKDLELMSLDKWLEFGSDNLLLLFAVRTCLFSIKAHPRNYYASNSLRFFIANSSSKLQLFKILIDFIENICDDLSLWLILIDSITDIKTKQMNWYRDEWKKYGGVTTTEYSHIDLIEVYNAIKSCMMKLKSYGSILTTIKIQHFLKIHDASMIQLQDKINIFEQKHNGKLDCKLNVLVDNETKQHLTFSNDSILREDFKFTLNIKKVFLDVYEKKN